MSYGRKAIHISSIIIFITIVAAYSLFQARKIIEGPRISVSSPINSVTTTVDKKFTVVGNAKNIAFLYMNDKKIFTDDNGNFKEEALLYPGHNMVELRAQDKFGHSITKNIVVYYAGL